MGYTNYIREICGGEEAGELPQEEAHQLFAALLDGGVPELELGALLVALHRRRASVGELGAYHRAVDERLYHIAAPAGSIRPLVIPAYGGAVRRPNLLPLLALLLKRFGIPVLIHGSLDATGRVSAAHVLRELGVLPSGSLLQAQRALQEEGLAFVPTALLSPGLASVLRIAGRLGVDAAVLPLARLMDPYGGEGTLLVPLLRGQPSQRMRDFLALANARALLLAATDGEPVADPLRRPRIELFCEGTGRVLFEAESTGARELPSLPAAVDARTTAHWIERALGHRVPLPMPIINQLACCLYACGYLPDMNQAKAIVAVSGGGLKVS